ncbi:MAG: cytochrome P450 [Pseudonocardia sp.]|nr:cytochrome P450 [Pseudonocardia sp.]
MTVTDLMAPEMLAHPYTEYGKLRERAPVLEGSFLGGSTVWVVTRYADVRAVLGDPETFANDASSVPGNAAADVRQQNMEAVGVPADLVHYLTDTIISVDGADHTRLRKLVSRAFTVRRVANLRPRVEAITAGLLDALAAAEQPVELVETFAYPLPITVICELVGIPEADRAAWHEWGRVLVSLDPARIPAALRDMITHVLDVIARRRAEPADDLLSDLVRVREDGHDGSGRGDRLSDDELVTMVLTLVIAGHETTAHLISRSVIALLARPDQLALLRADPGLWPNAVTELMRRVGPVQVASVRYATRDVEVGGVRVPAGSAIQPVLVSANSDPREYPDPDRLDVTRRTDRGEGHVGFGHGPHYCLGAALARQEGEVALRALFERFPGLAPAVAPEELEWAKVPGMRRVLALPLLLG